MQYRAARTNMPRSRIVGRLIDSEIWFYESASLPINQPFDLDCPDRYVLASQPADHVVLQFRSSPGLFVELAWRFANNQTTWRMIDQWSNNLTIGQRSSEPDNQTSIDLDIRKWGIGPEGLVVHAVTRQGTSVRSLLTANLLSCYLWPDCLQLI
jgi:hypothetical protein